VSYTAIDLSSQNPVEPGQDLRRHRVGDLVVLLHVGTAHEALATRFAGAVPPAERFTEEAWDFDTDGVPVLREALASVVGRIVADRAHGSHSVLFVEIDKETTEEDSGALVYFQRRFHNLAR
jgi:flavin reductase (NADH)